MTMTVMDSDLADVARTILETLFEFPLEAAAVSQPDGKATVTGVVHIDGAWHGAVMLRCPVVLAATLTSALFQAGVEPSADDVRDALGELTNMVAGNVKALLPGPCGISLPTVAFGLDYELSVVGTTPIAAAAFRCDGHPLIVTLVERARAGSDV